MAVIGAAASPEHSELRHALAQTSIAAGKIVGIAWIELGGFIEFGMAFCRRIGPQPANASSPFIALRQDPVEMGRVCAVDHVIGRNVAGFAVRSLDRGL